MKYPEEYLGNGVYVSYDGFEILLRTPRPSRARETQSGDDYIYMSTAVLHEFEKFLLKIINDNKAATEE